MDSIRHILFTRYINFSLKKIYSKNENVIYCFKLTKMHTQKTFAYLVKEEFTIFE